MPLPPAPPLWFCPVCGAPFVSSNMWHSCVKLDLAETFSNTEPGVVEAFEAFSEMVRSVAAERGARIRVIPQRTRVVIVARVRFAGAQPRRRFALVSFALRRRLDSPRIVKIDEYGPRCIGHHLRLSSADQVDDRLTEWLRESVGVGIQDDLYEWVPGSLD